MKRHISDDDIDQLLKAQPQDSTPGLDARLEALAQNLEPSPRATARPLLRWLAWSAPVAAAAALLLWMQLPNARPVPDYEQLLALDDDLAAATALLDPENRELCLDLPANPDPFQP